MAHEKQKQQQQRPPVLSTKINYTNERINGRQGNTLKQTVQNYAWMQLFDLV